MKNSWKIISGILLSMTLVLFLIGGTAAGQENDSVIEIVPDKIEGSQRVGNALISTESGAPLNLYRVNYPVALDTPEAMANQYLTENASLLHLKSVSLADIQHRMTRESLSGATVRYKQYVGSVPVYKAEIVVHINGGNLVTYVINDYKSNLQTVNLKPELGAQQAQRIAYDYLNTQGAFNYESMELVVYPGQTTRLAYQIRVLSETPLGDWEVLVDAHSGEIFKVVDLFFNQDGDNDRQDNDAAPTLATGNGNVFNPDPLTTGTATYGDTGYTDNGDAVSAQLTAQTMNVTLLDIELAGGMHTLRGPYAAIVDSESPNNGLFTQASSTFNFNRSQAGFEAVNTYYHIDASMRYINETLGITLMPSQYSGGVRFDPHGLGGSDNSHYSSGSGEVAFGEGGVDDAEDSDVVHHELGHGLHDWVTGGGLSQVNGLSEGSGDYWAQSYNRSIDSWTAADPAYNHVFRWDGHNEFWAGRVTNYGAVYPGGLTGGIHADGQIWSTCLMKIWDDIGKTKTDKIFLEGLGMTNSSTSQDGAANAAYQAAIDMGYSAADRQAIHTHFTGCGYTLPVLPSLEITKTANPSPVEAGGILEYTLQVVNSSGGTLTGVTISDNVPADTTYVNASATCGGSETAGVVSFPLGIMLDGAMVSCTFQVLVDAGLGGSTTFFSDDMESGDGNWTATHGSGAIDWALGAVNPHSGSSAWFANDIATITDQYMAMTAPVMALGSNAILSVWHNYNTENTYDGGVIEISTDSGTTWTDVGAFITQNGYTGPISSSFSSPISGRQAFSGNSSGYVETLVDLSSYAGNDVQIRFRMATDSSQSSTGWYVDDVAIATAGAAITNTACVTSNEGSSDCDTIVTPVDAATCSAPPAVTDLASSKNGSHIDLNWTGTGADEYEIHRKSNDFYFAPNGFTWIATTASNSYTDMTAGILGNVASNYAYVVVAKMSCGATAVPSNRVGEFDFGITAGMPSGIDTDGDRLPDSAETNTGIYVSPSNTGTDPNNVDTDGDSLEDGDEVLGTIDGLDLPSMGTNPLRQDILLEYDWFDDSLDCSAHSHQPSLAATTAASTAFANSSVSNPDGSSGINMINDYGQGGVFTGGNFINDSNGVISGGVNGSEFQAHKTANFATNRNGYFHYVLLPHRYNTNSSSSGQAELPGDDLVVSLYCFGSDSNVSKTILHELGHNLNLRHGGNENCNYKPNYNSVMNYTYQFPGVDDNCTPDGDGVLNYSVGDRITLDESNLNENNGTCGAPSWDWNGNSIIESSVAWDINSADPFQNSGCGGTQTVLNDYNDWANVYLGGLSDGDGALPFPQEIITEQPVPLAFQE